MLENMAGAVGFAMHEERLARVVKNMRLTEAERVRPARAGSYRASLARALVTLAARVAPTARLSITGAPTLAQ
jgi:hypothetical protein